MSMKTNFEDANFISSPFVDEIANPGTGSAGIDEARSAVDKQLKAAKIDNIISARASGKSAAPKKAAVVDKRNTGQKIMDRGAKRRAALKAALGQ